MTQAAAELKRLEGRVQRFLVHHPELLREPYLSRSHRPGVSPLAGHCYVACEALFHAGAHAAGYRPASVRVGGATHWFLRGPLGEVLDPTAEQFPPGSVDYAAGRSRGFLTRYPSRRTRVVLEALEAARRSGLSHRERVAAGVDHVRAALTILREGTETPAAERALELALELLA